MSSLSAMNQNITLIGARVDTVGTQVNTMAADLVTLGTRVSLIEQGSSSKNERAPIPVPVPETLAESLGLAKEGGYANTSVPIAATRRELTTAIPVFEGIKYAVPVHDAKVAQIEPTAHKDQHPKEQEIVARQHALTWQAIALASVGVPLLEIAQVAGVDAADGTFVDDGLVPSFNQEQVRELVAQAVKQLHLAARLVAFDQRDLALQRKANYLQTQKPFASLTLPQREALAASIKHGERNHAGAPILFDFVDLATANQNRLTEHMIFKEYSSVAKGKAKAQISLILRHVQCLAYLFARDIFKEFPATTLTPEISRLLRSVSTGVCGIGFGPDVHHGQYLDAAGNLVQAVSATQATTLAQSSPTHAHPCLRDDTFCIHVLAAVATHTLFASFARVPTEQTRLVLQRMQQRLPLPLDEDVCVEEPTWVDCVFAGNIDFWVPFRARVADALVKAYKRLGVSISSMKYGALMTDASDLVGAFAVCWFLVSAIDRNLQFSFFATGEPASRVGGLSSWILI
ncbi:hypothetical protein BCR44DRAFT_95624, partial [Catenaria anguillulae PL171]